MSSNAATTPMPSLSPTAGAQPDGDPQTVRLRINGVTHPVKDLSAGSCMATNVQAPYMAGQTIAGTLLLPAGHTPDTYAIEANVQSIDAGARTMICRFTNLSTQQIAQLNDSIKKLASKGNAAGATSAALAPSATPKAAYTRRQVIGLSTAGLLGLLALGVIAANIYEGLFVVRASQAVVTGASLDVRALQDGVFVNSLPADAKTVQKDQPLGELRTFDAAGVANATGQPLLSPCDCLVVAMAGVTGDSVLRGETLLTLVPTDAKPTVMAELPPGEAAKISADGDVTLNVAGSDVDYAGKVTAINASLGHAVLPGEATPQNAVSIKILPTQTLPVEFIGRPARVTFDAR